MVALLRLLQHMKIGVEFSLLVPGRAIDARQHRIVAVAAPIGAGHLHQLERVANLPRGSHMRPAAQVEPVALRVDLEILALRNGIDELDLVGFALVAKHLPGLVAAPDFLGERLVAADDLPHLLFDDGKFFQRERPIFTRVRMDALEVIVEAVFDHRTDGDLSFGPKLLHRLRQNVGRVVANEFERARIRTRDDLHSARRPERIGEVAQLAVEGDRDCLLCQGFGDGLG